MPGMIRPNKKAMQIAYKILKTPKSRQQKVDKNPKQKKKEEWFRDSSTAQ